MLSRTQAVRVRDQLFVDGLQDNYRQFSEQMELSYLIWQEQSQLELQAKRQAQIDCWIRSRRRSSVDWFGRTSDCRRCGIE